MRLTSRANFSSASLRIWVRSFSTSPGPGLPLVARALVELKWSRRGSQWQEGPVECEMVQAQWVSPPPALPALCLQACPFVDHHAELQVDVEFQPKNLAHQRIRHLVDEVVPNLVLEVGQNLEEGDLSPGAGEGGMWWPNACCNNSNDWRAASCNPPRPKALARGSCKALMRPPAPASWPADAS